MMDELVKGGVSPQEVLLGIFWPLELLLLGSLRFPGYSFSHVLILSFLFPFFFSVCRVAVFSCAFCTITEGFVSYQKEDEISHYFS